ncbi:hypothetical protein [Nocardia xishanensis]|uniref:hypothetical protein n=1 Tax=Nocardia xishanensis TaxID=238964 RepID=UPI000837727E|nr:hypothetical protein [Nocardia xishanensis]
MSARAVETTMPATVDRDEQAVSPRPPSPRSASPHPVCSASAPTPKAGALGIRPSAAGVSREELEERLIAAHQRAAELEEQLAAVVAARDAAEHEAAQLEDRNRELASDLDNALDQLAGHALHAEQERLIRVPLWSPWPESGADRGGFDR